MRLWIYNALDTIRRRRTWWTIRTFYLMGRKEFNYTKTEAAIYALRHMGYT